jgi:hypothetical protein
MNRTLESLVATSMYSFPDMKHSKSETNLEDILNTYWVIKIGFKIAKHPYTFINNANSEFSEYWAPMFLQLSPDPRVHCKMQKALQQHAFYIVLNCPLEALGTNWSPAFHKRFLNTFEHAMGKDLSYLCLTLYV